MNKLIIIGLLAWFFMDVGNYRTGSTTHGPFNTFKQCQEFRDTFKNKINTTTKCWEYREAL